MATLVLSAAGSALGGAFGGTLGGLSLQFLGRAAGSVAGGLIDQQVLGRGSGAIDQGRIESFRLQHAQEGAPIPRVHGRMRVGGQLIWSSDFVEHVDESRQGGKGGQKVREHRYTVSFAVALCEGKITRIGRVWADGNELRLEDQIWRLHSGGKAQQPDPLIDAIEGGAPAFRDIAYLVFEDMAIGAFGNRIPQINVEVFREPKILKKFVDQDEVAPPLSELVRAVALSPGSGEFALDTEPVERHEGRGRIRLENVNTLAERPDILPALDQLQAEAENCGAVSLVVSWFGDDLRCGRCEIRPGVETDDKETTPYVWEVNGVTRSAARLVSQDENGRPVFGGTPSDQSVMRAIQEMNARGLKVMFYPFLLMDIPAGNTLTDPWTGEEGQAAFPWRGRITLDAAPGTVGSADKTPDAAAETADFFGAAQAGEFTPHAEGVDYAGPAEWSFRRFILHYAHLCVAAGGVDSFCIGSEMRSLTQVRDGAASYPAVQALMTLAADVRAILGPDCKIGYAADWSEYFGHQPKDGSGDVLFHLDPLWAHADIDFIGIDNYLPLSDWRYREGHADADAGSVTSLPYLKGNVEGGEGFDWYYASAADRRNQVRTPITDTAHGEDWVFRPKDLRNWWSQPHHDRPGGVRASSPTAWAPGSKPIWFTEIGCPAVDLGANQPNVFIDPKSSESALPYFSRGVRDDFMQQRYLQAALTHWDETNPTSAVYGGPMVDLERAFIWTWDTRPFPDFPARASVWSDGGNYRLGHWISGRLGAAPLADVVADICLASGLQEIDVSGLRGVVDGMAQPGDRTARESLQPLMLAYGFDAVESGGVLTFRHRDGPVCATLGEDDAVLDRDGGRECEFSRQAEGEAPRAVRFSFIEPERDYEAGATEATAADAVSTRVESASAPLALDTARAQAVADRWLAEARAGRDGARVTAGRSMLALEPGDIVTLGGTPESSRWRIERVEELGRREMTLTRVEPLDHLAAVTPTVHAEPKPAAVATALEYAFLDLPLLRDGEAPVARFAAFAEPWTGGAALFLSRAVEDFERVGTASYPAVMGESVTTLAARSPDLWMRDGMDVRLFGGGLSSKTEQAVLNGDNLAAVKSPSGEWEMIQFSVAELVGERLYRLSGLLRGQRGTDAFIQVIPPGAEFVLLNTDIATVAAAEALRGVDLTYRIGPARKDYGHTSYREFVVAYDGVADRPYRPAHLRAVAGPDIALSWVRRTRIGGDAWGGAEAPLGEAAERYRVRVLAGGMAVRSVETTAPSFVYDAAMRAADGTAGAITFAVAQISERYGDGPEAEVIVNV